MHVDEGTIHTWLDGELPEAEASTVSAHVAGCAECGAMVAEARGLIAASHRIVSSLDDVQPGVTPGAVPRPAALSRRPRTWWQRPQLAAAAAVLVAAVGTWGVMRETGSPNEMPMAAEVSPTAPARELMDSAALTVQRPAAPPASVAPVEARRMQAADQAATGRVERDAANEAKSVAAAPPPAAPRPDSVRRELAKTAPAVAQEPVRARMADQVVARERDRLQGEMTAQTALQRSARASAGQGAVAGAVASAATANFTKRPDGPRCFDLVLGDSARAAGVPPSVDLTNTPLMGVPGRTLYMAQAAGQQAWFWSLSADQTITLVRVNNNRVVYEVPLRTEGTGEVVGTVRECRAR